MAREMGANTVRTWGTRQGTPAYLDSVYEAGLFVNAGIWLNPAYEDGTCSYITDNPCTRQARRETIEYVSMHKDHPAILFWNIGNEVVHWTKSEEERVAFARFLEELIQEVHAIDPNHPVIYTSAYTTAVDYIARYVPSLDILGLNIYGGLEEAHEAVVSKLDIPYVVTEFGPLGPWSQPTDVNGKAIDLTDVEKAFWYETYATLIQQYRGHCLGGYAFYLGESNQVSLTWWNVNFGPHKRSQFLTLEQLYAGRPIQNKPPHVSEVTLSKQQNLNPNEEFEICVRMREPEQEAVTFRYLASTVQEEANLEEFQNQEIPLVVEGRGSTVKARAPMQAGVYRIYAVAVDPHGLAGTASTTISVQ